MLNLEQEEGKPYGVCMSCGTEIADYDAMQAHFSETMHGTTRGSHSIRVTNPTREERVQQAIDRIVYDSIEDALSKLEREVGYGRAISLDEARKALRHHETFLEMWDQEYADDINDSDAEIKAGNDARS